MGPALVCQKTLHNSSGPLQRLDFCIFLLYEFPIASILSIRKVLCTVCIDLHYACTMKTKGDHDQVHVQ